jgi:choline monooxygenase
MLDLAIEKDIKKATTLPGAFYNDQAAFEEVREKIFVKTWQYIGDVQNTVRLNESTYPFTLLDGYLNEPLLLTRNKKGEVNCMSNVCTHRGNIVINNPGPAKSLMCGYHGRRWELDGSFKNMPEFKEAENFPRACDGLTKVPLKNWADQFLFASIDPLFDFTEVLNEMEDRVGFLPLDQFKFDANRSKDYLVNANWALYCDNYLEGFHIPFVHPDLNEALDYKNYRTVVGKHWNLQVGAGSPGTDCFKLPQNHKDYGQEIAAYYYWIFPNMMFNFYPWGLSINIVRPLAKDLSKVSFLTYIYDESKLERGAGALLDKVEREDEFVVEGVQKGIQSRLYQNGRFSPTREQGVHHFHGLLSEYLNK